MRIQVLLIAVLILCGGANAADHAEYWCAYSDDLTVFHIGKADSGQVVSSGLDHLDKYDTEAELETRVDELMGEGYYAAWKEEQD
jgi:hypothetical protein